MGEYAKVEWKIFIWIEWNEVWKIEKPRHSAPDGCVCVCAKHELADTRACVAVCVLCVYNYIHKIKFMILLNEASLYSFKRCILCMHRAITLGFTTRNNTMPELCVRLRRADARAKNLHSIVVARRSIIFGGRLHSHRVWRFAASRSSRAQSGIVFAHSLRRA